MAVDYRWIGQGSPAGSEEDATILRIEVRLSRREMNVATKQQLSVVAHYSDGSTLRVTRLASCKPSAEMDIPSRPG